MSKNRLAAARRVVVKIGSALLVDADTGALNLLRVGGASGAGGTGGAGIVTPLPEVEFIAGLVEFGEHDPGAYNILASIPVEGRSASPRSLSPSTRSTSSRSSAKRNDPPCASPANSTWTRSPAR